MTILQRSNLSYMSKFCSSLKYEFLTIKILVKQIREFFDRWCIVFFVYSIAFTFGPYALYVIISMILFHIIIYLSASELELKKYNPKLYYRIVIFLIFIIICIWLIGLTPIFEQLIVYMNSSDTGGPEGSDNNGGNSNNNGNNSENNNNNNKNDGKTHKASKEDDTNSGKRKREDSPKEDSSEEDSSEKHSSKRVRTDQEILGEASNENILRAQHNIQSRLEQHRLQLLEQYSRLLVVDILQQFEQDQVDIQQDRKFK